MVSSDIPRNTERVEVRTHRPNHPWIFSNELVVLRKDIPAGSVVDIYKGKKCIGRGFYNPHSLITLRRFSDQSEDFNLQLVEGRFMKAADYRKKVIRNESCRMVFSESDGLPGLIVDKYGKNLVVQIHCYGMDQRRALVIDALKKFSPPFIYEKSDEYLRKLEGLAICNGVRHGAFQKVVEIEQDSIRLLVDIEQGQKTGFFFDLAEIRKYVFTIARQKRVLDLCCYTGSFSLYAACAGAAAVVGIDSSRPAIELAKENARLNEQSKVAFECGDVFEYLKADKDKYDIIILDPPSFTKSKAKAADARRGYKELNLRAMSKLNKEGILITTCCSYHVAEEDFLDILERAARDAGVRFRIIGREGQSPDHPVLLSMPESRYLKCYYLQVP